jgi:hypothetical protein
MEAPRQNNSFLIDPFTGEGGPLPKCSGRYGSARAGGSVFTKEPTVAPSSFWSMADSRPCMKNGSR